MILHQRDHLVDDRRLDADPIEKAARQRTCRGFMPVRGPAQPAVFLAQLRGIGLGEIVRQSRKQQGGARRRPRN